MVAFATAEECATFLQDPVNQAQAEMYLDMASDEVRDYCGWRIDRGTETFRLTGNYSPALLLPTMQLNDVTSVSIDGTVVTDYTWSPEGVLYRDRGWASKARGVEVTCDHGYDKIPGIVRITTVQAACRALVNPGGLRSITASLVTEIYAIPATGQAPILTLMVTEMRILNRYRIFT